MYVYSLEALREASKQLSLVYFDKESSFHQPCAHLALIYVFLGGISRG
jgi:hypothetical protein